MNFKKISLAVAFSLATPLISASTVAVEKLPKALQMAITSGGFKIEKSFKAEGGLTGWVVSQGPGKNLVVYTPEKGDVFIIGNMITADGKNLTKDYLDEHAPKPEYDKLWGLLEKSSWVATGTLKNPKSIVYVFKDFNCGYCHLAWKALEPYEAKGLQVRWVPVAFLAESSVTKAAFVMQAKNKQAAFDQIQKAWGNKNAQFPVSPATATVEAIQANGNLMNEWGFRGTPATIYKNAKGQVEAKAGMFRLSEIPSMTGLAFIDNKDPQLQDFK